MKQKERLLKLKKIAQYESIPLLNESYMAIRNYYMSIPPTDSDFNLAQKIKLIQNDHMRVYALMEIANMIRASVRENVDPKVILAKAKTMAGFKLDPNAVSTIPAIQNHLIKLRQAIDEYIQKNSK